MTAWSRRIVILGLGATVAGCARSAKTDGLVLRVANQKGTLKAIMVASGALAGAAYPIEWSEFGAASPLLEALAAGAVDLGAIGEAPFAFAIANGAPIVAVSALAAQSGGRSVAILVPQASTVRDIAGLAGRRIAAVRGSVGHYLLIRVLQQAGIDPRTVDTVFLAPSEAKAALAEGSVDGWATWSPYIGIATAAGANRILVDGCGLFSGISYIAATRSAVADKAALIRDFLVRLGKAQAWGRAYPDRHAAALALETRLPLAVARDTIARQQLSMVPIDAGVVNSTTATLRHFQAAGVVAALPDLGMAFTKDFNLPKEIAP